MRKDLRALEEKENALSEVLKKSHFVYEYHYIWHCEPSKCMWLLLGTLAINLWKFSGISPGELQGQSELSKMAIILVLLKPDIQI